jgi:uncharacterized membrane protein
VAHGESEPDEGRQLGFERLLFFSDAVFAIAITILVLDLRPEDVLARGFDLTPLLPKLTGFAVSFYVIGRYWAAHHDLFVRVRGYDGRLITTNLWFLFGIVFLPFTTAVVVIARADPGPVILYAASLTYVGLMMVVLIVVARRPGLLAPGQTRGGTWDEVVNAAAAPVVFALTTFAGLFDAHHAMWLLLLLFPLSPAAARLGKALKRRVDGA